MSSLDKIKDLEIRAARVGISIAKLCKLADVANSTFTRWKSQETDPKFSTYDKLDAALKPLEAQLKPRSKQRESLVSARA